ncbi:Hypothetical predicted protein [Paramuricea clavata]|uniref:Uncharacterized protein n=1 Tax=Paramuricea clavata TaxID=317549 RepID=A0A6S7KEF6_PARCT|nr:Hypothetical predicted protein [Paramuricea clavata]
MTSLSRKEYYANRDSSKIYLFDCFPRWRAFKEQHNLRTDKDVANMLLDGYVTRSLEVCNAETQTDINMRTSELLLSSDMPVTPPMGSRNFPSPVDTSTPSAPSIRRRLLSDRNPIGEETLSASSGERSDDEFGDDFVDFHGATI